MAERTENWAEMEKLLADLKAVVRDGQEFLKATVASAREQAATRLQSTDRLAREHPYETLGVAFGIGLIVGLIVSGGCCGEARGESD